MFTVSDNASYAIRQIVARPEIPEGAGLRIDADGNRTSLSIAVSPEPEPGDTVVDAGTDAKLFVSAEAGELLEHKTIDARTDEAGRVQFVLDTLAE
ncbi:adhesin [Paractinoplanes rishiriensis]|uniref:Fe-S cluster assembly iron-binding protein IscA n=1 Tax=Paractinoplanes rishiriensis TaxID=1050105 RepID=A0A919N1E0_9ACTN|nr:adhesin [Actinoplanes rishiriensis]GIF01211.1 hypothetical protein Ari01nite_86750 [Actinoplanes rishiriensis]